MWNIKKQEKKELKTEKTTGGNADRNKEMILNPKHV